MSPEMDTEHLAEADKKVEQRSLKVVVGVGAFYISQGKSRPGERAGIKINPLGPASPVSHLSRHTYPGKFSQQIQCVK